jgi:hypothetical protein
MNFEEGCVIETLVLGDGGLAQAPSASAIPTAAGAILGRPDRTLIVEPPG